MRLAIADPPYPPHRDGQRRASRWYGSKRSASDDPPADFHPDAAEWDDPVRHRSLLVELLDTYDGWAIATSADGVRCYEPLPHPCRVMAWVRPDGVPGQHRIVSKWEAVIVYPPPGRRSYTGHPGGRVSDVWTGSVKSGRAGFRGAKPIGWTHWVLDALGHDPDTDTVDDLFPGSGMVTAAINTQRLPL